MLACKNTPLPAFTARANSSGIRQFCWVASMFRCSRCGLPRSLVALGGAAAGPGQPRGNSQGLALGIPCAFPWGPRTPRAARTPRTPRTPRAPYTPPYAPYAPRAPYAPYAPVRPVRPLRPVRPVRPVGCQVGITWSTPHVRQAFCFVVPLFSMLLVRRLWRFAQIVYFFTCSEHSAVLQH